MGSVTVGIENKRRAAHFGIVRDTRKGRSAWYLDCTCCRNTLVLDMSEKASPDEMLPLITRKGWTISRKAPPLCKSCSQGAKEAKMNAQAKTIAPDMKITRKVMNALEDHFDEDKHLFKPGWSDQKIADDLGVALPVVVTIRKDAFGELAEDPALTSLRDDIELLRMEFTEKSVAFVQDFNKRLVALEAKLPKQSKKAIC